MPDVYISRAGMESKQLDEKFKSTQIEELQKEFSKYKFEKNKESEDLQNQINAQNKNLEKMQVQMTKLINFFGKIKK